MASALSQCVVAFGDVAGDLAYAACLKSALNLQFSLGDLSGTSDIPLTVFGPDFPCKQDGLASQECCSALEAARLCVPVSGSVPVARCDRFLKGVLFESFQCSTSVALPIVVAIYAIVAVVLIFVVFRASRWLNCGSSTYSTLATTKAQGEGKYAFIYNKLRHTSRWARQLKALLVKNFQLLQRNFVRRALSHVCVLMLVGVFVAAVALANSDNGQGQEFTSTFGSLLLVSTEPGPAPKLLYQSLRPFGGMFFLVAFATPFVDVVVSVVQEKESRLRDRLHLHGVSDFVLIVSWLLTYMVVFTPLVAAVAASTHFGGVFISTPFAVVWLFFLMFTVAMVSLCLAISVFFPSSRSAALFLLAVSLASYFLALQTSIDAQTQWALFPPVGLALGISDMLYEASGGTGAAIRVHHEYVPSSSISVSVAITRMALGCLISLAVSWYATKVWPQHHTARLPVYFLLDPKYWFGTPHRSVVSNARAAAHSAGKHVSTPRAHSQQHNAEERNLCARGRCVAVNKLSCVPNNIAGVCGDLLRDHPRNGVKDLELVMCEAQITVLLGPSGAGKSTLLGMLSGAITPTGGDATVYGLSVKHQMDDVRAIIGVCPQREQLYMDLSVGQNLRLFAEFKHVQHNKINEQIAELMGDLAILEKEHVPVGRLSRGDRRKLVRFFVSSLLSGFLAGRVLCVLSIVLLFVGFLRNAWPRQSLRRCALCGLCCANE
jgi:ABC-type multidrug transport system fused ATPase/permease subunit